MIRQPQAREGDRASLPRLLACALVIVCQFLGGALPRPSAADALQRAELAAVSVVCDSARAHVPKTPAHHRHAADPAILAAIAVSAHAVALPHAGPFLVPPAGTRIAAISRPKARAPPATAPVPYQPTGPPSLA